jgi:hypothetical protein
MKLGKGSVDFNAKYAINSTKFGSIVLDTGAASKIAKGKDQADVIFSEMVKAGWCMIMPMSVVFELGLGPDSEDQSKETAFWNKAIYHEGAIPYLSRQMVGMGIAFQQGDVDLYRGMVTPVVPGESEWLFVKFSGLSRYRKNPRTSHASIMKSFMDELVFTTARNLFSAIWTDDHDDLLGTQIRNHREYEVKKTLSPVFTTEDLNRVINGESATFPTAALQARVKADDVKKALAEYKG